MMKLVTNKRLCAYAYATSSSITINTTVAFIGPNSNQQLRCVGYSSTTSTSTAASSLLSPLSYRIRTVTNMMNTGGSTTGSVRFSTTDTSNFIGRNVTLAIETIKNADVVCFDVDSTVIQEEGIDVLASYLNKGQQVSALTKQAMEGGLKFQDALQARLNLLQPSQLQIYRCMEQHPFTVTPKITELIYLLQTTLQKDVYLISGGFRIMIEPIAEQLNISQNNIIANTLLFDFDGFYDGFDSNEPTSEDMGKARAMQMVIQEQKNKKNKNSIISVMIGDGMTDTQAKPPATTFIGFGGIARRRNVEYAADWYVLDFQDIIDQLQTK